MSEGRSPELSSFPEKPSPPRGFPAGHIAEPEGRRTGLGFGVKGDLPKQIPLPVSRAPHRDSLRSEPACKTTRRRRLTSPQPTYENPSSQQVDRSNRTRAPRYGVGRNRRRHYAAHVDMPSSGVLPLARRIRPTPAYWQASQSGLSIEQNFASVAGVLSTGAAATGAAAAYPPSTGTAFSSPPRPVDFSAEDAPSVRR